MRVMALFQLHFLQNACVQVRMDPGQGHLCYIYTFLVYIIIMNLSQNVCHDHFWVRFSKCYDTQVSNTGPSWPSCCMLDHNCI